MTISKVESKEKDVLTSWATVCVVKFHGQGSGAATHILVFQGNSYPSHRNQGQGRSWV